MGKSFKNVETLPELLLILFIGFVIYAIFKNSHLIYQEISGGIQKMQRELSDKLDKLSHTDVPNRNNNLLKKINLILKANENSKIEPSRAIAYLGGIITRYVINELSLNLNKKEETTLEILFASVLIYQTFEVFRVNHLADLITKDFQRDIVDEVIMISLSENHSLPPDIRQKYSTTFKSKFNSLSTTFDTYGEEINSLLISGYIVNQIYLFGVDKYRLNKIISEPLKTFNYSTVLRIKKSFNT